MLLALEVALDVVGFVFAILGFYRGHKSSVHGEVVQKVSVLGAAKLGSGLGFWLVRCIEHLSLGLKQLGHRFVCARVGFVHELLARLSLVHEHLLLGVAAWRLNCFVFEGNLVLLYLVHYIHSLLIGAMHHCGRYPVMVVS